MDPEKDFHHSPVRNKDYQKVWSSPSDPVHFEVDASHEKLESNLEADARNVSSLCQDLTRSDSPFYMDTSSTNSDLPQNEIKNVKREDESKLTLAEEIYSTLDDWLGDFNIGNDSQNVLPQLVDPSISSFRQFEPICKFHHTEAFSNEMITFQNLKEGLPYTVQPEMQNHVYYCAKGTNIKEDSFKEENSLGTSTSTNEEQFAHKCVIQPSRSPPVVHSSGETVKFMEMSLAKSAATESALKPSQPQSFWYEENVPSDVDKPFYKENGFNQLDLKANYATEKISVSSKGIQSSGDIPEMPVSHQKEVTVEDMDRPGTVSYWSPAVISWSSGASQEDSKAPDMEQSLESLQPLEEDMALNEVLRKLKHTNKRQQTLIQDLQCSNKYLEKKVEELQRQTTKQQVFVDINKLKEKVEELIEDKYRVMLEKNDTEKTLQNLQEVLANTQKHLQESRNEKETLQLELKKVKGNYVHLQERYMTEMQQKDKTVSQCMEMNRTLSEKEEEVERLKQLKGELKKATTSALDLLKREKKTREHEFLSLREEFQKHEKKNLEERQKLKSRLEKLLTQVNNLQFISENEKGKNAKLKQQDAKMIHSNLFLNCSPCEKESLNPPDVKRTSQLVSKLHSLLALVIGLLTCQDITTTDAEYFKDCEKISDIMLQKLKHFHLKKKNLDKELLKHKDRITAFRELITNEKAFQDRVTEVTGFESDETKNVGDVPILLGAKRNKYHSLNEELDCLITKLGNLLESKEDHCNRLIEENDKYQRYVGNLINKVTSYEEIIECADQRLEISRSHIVHLEKRNKHLEDLVRRPRKKARKSRPRRLEYHPKSLTVLATKPRKMKLNHPCSLPCSLMRKRLKQKIIY
uniref:cancer-associated gene 1 protein isoform X7 n=1 Tax=Panthera onca TaxID=9690 RepID=UPI0029553DFA|nr:cancer-associated gene 1 protein isoform X7 [Panthera onca]